MFKKLKVLNKFVQIVIVLVLVIAPLATAKDFVKVALADEIKSDAVVLVNSASANYYADFQHYIQPYLDNFGVPYTVLDIATDPVGADVGDYALIIVGHRQLDPDGTYLGATEEGYISAAVTAGTGLVNFDNDLSVGGTSPRYQFIQDIFDFGYLPPSTGSGVTFTSETGAGLQINCWEDDHQIPVLTTTSNVADLQLGVADLDGLWTEFLYTPSRDYPTVLAGADEEDYGLQVMRFYASDIPNGEYEVIANLYTSGSGRDMRYYYGYSSGDPKEYSVETVGGAGGPDQHDEYSLGTVTITDGTFNIYVQDADLTGSGTYPFFGWAWIRLVPASAPPPVMHYITERHEAGESIGTGSMTMAGITLSEGVTALAMTGSQPFLSVTNHGLGNAVQWGSYNWMSHAVKGPVYGLDDLVWRSIVWAARKPFVMQGLPNFVTMRVDDESGPFGWIEIANEFGIKPWAGLFYQNVNDLEAAQLSSLVNSGNATASVHAKTGAFFYYNHGVGDFPDAEIAANFVHATAWHANNDIPISKFVLPHYYEFGTNVFQGLSDWGVEFVGTQMDPGNGYGAPWIMNGPYRLYETGGSSTSRPMYYADFMTIPYHPGFDGQFFNCVTEIRDDAGYEWYPSNDVAGSIGRGTRQTKRALDSMALATLFTHGNYVHPITAENWHTILQGITDNLAPYNPIYVTMDHACQYVRSMKTSDIVASSYDTDSREITTTLDGETDMPTMFYLFTEQGGDIHHVLVDVPAFSGSTEVEYTLAGPLDHIVVTPNPATVSAGATQQFTAQGYDADDNPIPNLPFTWSVVYGGGSIDQSGLFTAGTTSGTYANTVAASFGTIQGTASVEIVIPPVDHFTFDTISSSKYVGMPFNVTITARDAAGDVVLGYGGQANLSDTTGTISPAVTGDFANGVWSGPVTIVSQASGVTITADDGGVSGASNSFDVLAESTCPCSIWSPGIAVGGQSGDGNAVELGVKFRADTDGYIAAVRFYKHPLNTGVHLGNLWTRGGTNLGSVTFSGETGSGWQQAYFATPIPVQADTTYVASYHTNSGHYAQSNYYFSTSGVDNPPLHALQSGVDGLNGVYHYGAASAFPTNTWNDGNYWVDVVFVTDLAVDHFTFETISTKYAGLPFHITITARDASGNVATWYNGQANLSDTTATLSPAVTANFVNGVWSGPVAITTQASGVTITASDGAAVGDSNSFDVIAPVSGSYSIWDGAAASGSHVADVRALELGLRFRAGVDGHITALRFYKDPANNGPHVGHLWTSDGTLLVEATFISETADGWQQVMLAEPVPIQADTTYIASYHSSTGYTVARYYFTNGVDNPPLRALADNDAEGPNGVYCYDTDPCSYPVNSYQSSNYWVDVIFVPAPPLNEPPVADAGGPYTYIDEGDSVTLDASGSSDPDDNIVLYEWDLDNDGEYDDATGVTTDVVFDDNGVFTVGLRVTDEFDESDTDTADVTVDNVAPTATFNAPAEVDEGSTINLSLTDPYDPSSADTTAGFEYAFDCGDGGGYGTWSSSSSAVCPTTDNGSRTVKGKIKDKDGGETEYTGTVLVNNVAPTATFNAPAEVDEGDDINLSLSEPYDPSSDDTVAGFEYAFDCGVGTGYGAWSATNTAVCSTTDDDVRTVKGRIRDKDGGETEYSASVTINNVAPAVIVYPPNQTVQYSDGIQDVTFTATDVAADTMTAATTPDPLPDSLVLTDNGCTTSGGVNTCTWTLSGIADVPTGVYTIRVTVADEDGGQTDTDITINVEPEDATVTFDGINPVAERVVSAGENSGPFSLTVYVQETIPDDAPNGAEPGDISLAVVSMELVPVGPGGPVAGTCTPNGVSGADYDSILAVTCNFNDVEVNTYTVQVTVDGGYYTGSGEDVLVVYDPSLGFATGGGWFYWPDSNDKTNFGFNMKYNKKGKNIQGSLLLIRHLPDGTIYRVKSNALFGLALGEATEVPMGWATFSGKSTYQVPGWPEPIGNHTFIVYVEDRDEPGTGIDRFWIEVIGGMSIARDAIDNAIPIEGGNIVVPH